MIYRVQCSKGCSYDQDIDSDMHPIICGACGCRVIRVWTIVFDTWLPEIMDEVKAKLDKWAI